MQFKTVSGEEHGIQETPNHRILLKLLTFFSALAIKYIYLLLEYSYFNQFMVGFTNYV